MEHPASLVHRSAGGDVVRERQPPIFAADELRQGDQTAGAAAELSTLQPLQHATTDLLRIALCEAGTADGDVVLLLHGYPYDIHSYVEVIPRLASAGCRVIVPYLRGHGPTQFFRGHAPVRATSGHRCRCDRADGLVEDSSGHFAGFDWGGRAGCAAAALWPDRCAGLVSVKSYLIQDVKAATITPIRPDLEAGLWYFHYFLTERGEAGLSANREGIAEVIWKRNLPNWRFDQRTFRRAAAATDNPDYVPVVLHSYRHRLGQAPGFPPYDRIEAELAAQPPIPVPAVTLDGMADGNFPAEDGTGSAHHFTGPRVHHQVPNAGHNLPQEAPDAFAAAVLEVRNFQLDDDANRVVGQHASARSFRSL